MIATTKSTHSTARIFEDVGGFYICSDALPYLDARGCAYPSRRAAISSLRSRLAFDRDSFTHYLSKGRKVKL
jgi:hypothetical protein